MFKPKKINENAIKKDFFKTKKENKIEFINFKIKIKETIFIETNEFNKIILPNENEIKFITSSKNRSIVDFANIEDIDEIYLFCSRLNEKNYNQIKIKNLKGIGLSKRVLEINEDFFNKVKKETLVKLDNNHSKMILFKIKENHYVVTGSGNASINSRVENYIIKNYKELYCEIIKFFNNA